MKRRDFMKVVGAGAVGVQAGCATLPLRGDELFSAERLDAFLAQYDSGLATIDRGSDRRPFGSPGGSEGARGEAMAKRALRSLYAVGAFADLEVEEQAHPGVQARMARLLPELSESLQECTAYLEVTAPGSRLRIREALAENPDLPLQLAEAVDDAGGAAGVSARTRRKFRLAATQLGFRLRHHDPALLAGEYVTKVRKIEAWSGDRARLQRQIVARIGAASLADKEARFVAAQGRWATLVSYEQEGIVTAAPGPTPGSGAARAAAWSFGIGLVAGGLGLLMLASGEFAGVFGLTVGAAALVVGLILLLISGVQYGVHRITQPSTAQAAAPSAPEATPVAVEGPGPPGEK
jgi:hypothetical protein